MNKIDFFVQRGDEAYFAECEQFAIVTQGESIDELIKNIYEAVDLYFEDSTTELQNYKLLVHYELPELSYA